MQHVLLLSPLFNDAVSFNQLASRVEDQLQAARDRYTFSFLVVNDGSDGPLHLKSRFPRTELHLHRNLGHQKAIAVGLSYAHHHLSFDQVIILDCDGEDRPEDIPRLLQAAQEGGRIVFARRRTRQEGSRFRFFYRVYKAVFRLLTGRQISFGNFMLLPRADAGRIVYYPEIWSHLAGSILKAGLPYRTVATDRGHRYAGNSRMNFHALLLHGLGAIGVFTEVIASRLLLFSLALVAFSVLSILVIIGIRFFTDLAIPGWATTAVSSMLIVLLQSFLLSLFTIFQYISSQTQRKFIPAHHYPDYVQRVETRN